MNKKEKALAAAKKALDRGQLDKAAAEYKIVATEDPKDTRNWLKLAELHVKRNKKSEATEAYLRAADLYTEQGFFQRAVAVYKNVLKLTPGFVEAHFKLADLFRQLGLLSDAMQQYELAAGVYQKEGRMSEALNAMRRIVDLNPDHVMSRIKLAEAASLAGLIDEAIEEFGRAGEHLKMLGKLDEYLRVSERLLSLTPENVELAKEMAEAYIERGNARFALAKLQPCFKLDARDQRTLALLAQAFEQLGHVAKTVSVLKELARIHRDEGRDSESLATYQKILMLDPSDNEARNESARAQRATMPVLPIGAGGAGRKSPAAITFSEMAVPQFLLPRDSSASGSFPPLPQTGDAFESAGGTAADEGPLSDTGNPAISRIISEADVFVKYALLDRAADHLRKVFDIDAEHAGSRERLAYVLLQLGRNAEAATQFALLAEQFRGKDQEKVAEFTRHAVAARPARPPDAGTEPGTQLGQELQDEAEEVLDLDEVGAQFIDEEPTSGRPAVTEMATSDWAPATSAEFKLPDMDEFANVESTSGGTSGGAAMLADLEQIDFLLQAELADEAEEIVNELMQNYPDHPEVLARRERLSEGRGAVPTAPGSAPAPTTPPPAPALRPGGSHQELGQAYRDMGLYDAAIKEFSRMLTDPKREVFALLCMGECSEQKNAITDAVIHYKKALNSALITDDEQTRIYYRLGHVFELLSDNQEALYFFEKVRKRDAKHGDVAARIEKVKRADG